MCSDNVQSVDLTCGEYPLGHTGNPSYHTQNQSEDWDNSRVLELLNAKLVAKYLLKRQWDYKVFPQSSSSTSSSSSYTLEMRKKHFHLLLLSRGNLYCSPLWFRGIFDQTKGLWPQHWSFRSFSQVRRCWGFEKFHSLRCRTARHSSFDRGRSLLHSIVFTWMTQIARRW